MIRTLVGQKQARKLWVRLKMMHKSHSETSHLQTMTPQDKPKQEDHMFLLSITLQTLLTWECKQHCYNAKKTKTQLEWQRDGLVKAFLSVAKTLLHLGVIKLV